MLDGFCDYNRLLQIVDGLAGQLQDLTAQHAADVAALRTRIEWLERDAPMSRRSRVTWFPQSQEPHREHEA